MFISFNKTNFLGQNSKISLHISDPIEPPACNTY